MEAAKKQLEEMKKAREKPPSGNSSRSAVVSGLSQRKMNASGGSFKATDVRASAQEDLDKMSMGGSTSSLLKKKEAPRTLKPLTKSATTKGNLSSKGKNPSPAIHHEIITSGSLAHKRPNPVNDAETGGVINMGLGAGVSVNPKRNQRK